MKKNERFFFAMILAILFSYVAPVFSTYAYLSLGDQIEVESAKDMDDSLVTFTKLLEELPLVIVCACWLYSLSKANHRNIYLWTFAGLAINIYAVLFFFLLMLYQSAQQPAHAADTGHELS